MHHVPNLPGLTVLTCAGVDSDRPTAVRCVCTYADERISHLPLFEPAEPAHLL